MFFFTLRVLASSFLISILRRDAFLFFFRLQVLFSFSFYSHHLYLSPLVYSSFSFSLCYCVFQPHLHSTLCYSSFFTIKPVFLFVYFSLYFPLCCFLFSILALLLCFNFSLISISLSTTVLYFPSLFSCFRFRCLFFLIPHFNFFPSSLFLFPLRIPVLSLISSSPGFF